MRYIAILRPAAHPTVLKRLLHRPHIRYFRDFLRDRCAANRECCIKICRKPPSAFYQGGQQGGGILSVTAVFLFAIAQRLSSILEMPSLGSCASTYIVIFFAIAVRMRQPLFWLRHRHKILPKFHVNMLMPFSKKRKAFIYDIKLSRIYFLNLKIFQESGFT